MIFLPITVGEEFFDTLAKNMAAITILFSRHYFQDSVVLWRIELLF